VSRVVATAATWGVGLVGTTPWPVSPADIADETEIAVEQLRMLGLPAGGLVLIVSRLAETIHVAPIELAAGRLDARWSCADATDSDAFRTGALVRQLSPDVVIGVNATILSVVDPAVFAPVPVVAVTDDVAHTALPNSRWWLKVGPTNAFECDARAGAHVDATRWRIATSGDEIVISNKVERLRPAQELATGVRGRIDREACACGRTSPRIVVA